MGYCFERSLKIKSFKHMQNVYNHNLRLATVPNANPELENMNEELISTNGKTYEMCFYETISSLKAQGCSGTVRKNGVLALEIILGFSHEDIQNVDTEEWKKKNIDWLNRFFNPTDAKNRNGESIKTDNVVSAVYHGDETNPHIHAIIIPINDKGNLSAKYYTGGKAKMIETQDSYAMEMEKFGLKRGERNTVAQHNHIKDFYKALNKAQHDRLPEPVPGENINSYRKRAENIFQERNAQYLGKELKMQRELDVLKAKNITERLRVDSLKRDVEKKEKLFIKEKEKIALIVGDSEFSLDSLYSLRKIAERELSFEKALDSYPNREAAENLRRNYMAIMAWQRQEERRRKKIKEQHKNERGTIF